VLWDEFLELQDVCRRAVKQKKGLAVFIMYPEAFSDDEEDDDEDVDFDDEVDFDDDDNDTDESDKARFR
jgi:hypothetical protein